jgi:hypothetical protein
VPKDENADACRKKYAPLLLVHDTDFRLHMKETFLLSSKSSSSLFHSSKQSSSSSSSAGQPLKPPHQLHITLCTHRHYKSQPKFSRSPSPQYSQYTATQSARRESQTDRLRLLKTRPKLQIHHLHHHSTFRLRRLELFTHVQTLLAYKHNLLAHRLNIISLLLTHLSSWIPSDARLLAVVPFQSARDSQSGNGQLPSRNRR